ncbi:MAG: SprB repeat-containing protein [Bacteroidetes bacterium]|nr:SprB repeat-containing protein [Bacteroidota bacterium]
MRQLYLFIASMFLSLNVAAQCSVNATAISNASCGLNNGSVMLVFGGNNPPYFVNFNGTPYGSSNGAPLTINNLAPGNYSFSVTDNPGTICTGAANITVSSWGNPLQVNFNIINPTCPTCTDGSITAAVTGGFAPYYYQWNNGASTSVLSGLAAGIYVLSVYDTLGCGSIDTVILNYGGVNIYSLSGKAFFDVDNDSVYGVNDIPLANQQIEKQPSGQVFYTDQNGDYVLGDSSGAMITLAHLSTNGFSVSNGLFSHAVTVGSSNISGLNFALAPDSMFHSISTSTFSSLPRCNTNVGFHTSITNQGTYIDSGTVTFNFDPLMVYTSSTPAGSISGNSISFTFSNLMPFETRSFTSFFTLPGNGITLYTSTTTASFDGTGTVLCADTSYEAFLIRCSFDPNDKTVSPEGVGANHRVDMDTELRYLIRFQNTGNDTAFTVVVTDTISSGLNINSLYVIATSHVCWIEKIGGELMRFHFDDILLPDSNVNEPESHGYVYFRVKGNPNNTDPTTVTNKANIFFDFNPPIVTNTTLTTFSNSTVGISTLEYSEIGSIQLSPHPMIESTLLLFEGNKDHAHVLELMDTRGRKVVGNKTFKGSSYLLQRESLLSGIYFIKITDIVDKSIYYTRLLVY